MADPSFTEHYGFSVFELLEMEKASDGWLDSELAVLSRRILEQVSPEVCEAIRQALLKPYGGAYSRTGQMMLIMFHDRMPDKVATWQSVLQNFMSHPTVFRDVSVWCFFFAILEGSAKFQIDNCPGPSREERLTGQLLGKLESCFEAWRKVAAEPLGRANSSIVLEQIDLSILGGEQATGGDFGLILDFTGSAIRPHGEGAGTVHRIVPLVFQAKRFCRPTADVSQRHELHGLQRDLLVGNKCTSAYVFYENGSEAISHPLPPLVKSATDIRGDKTNVFEETIDLPTYLLSALMVQDFARTADTADEALRMIFAKADASQLSHLAVIASDLSAGERYSYALRELEREIRDPDEGEKVER